MEDLAKIANLIGPRFFLGGVVQCFRKGWVDNFEAQAISLFWFLAREGARRPEVPPFLCFQWFCSHDQLSLSLVGLVVSVSYVLVSSLVAVLGALEEMLRLGICWVLDLFPQCLVYFQTRRNRNENEEKGNAQGCVGACRDIFLVLLGVLFCVCHMCRWRKMVRRLCTPKPDF